MTDPVDDYLKTPRGKEALAYHLGKLFDREEQPVSLLSPERNEEFEAMMVAIIPALEHGRVNVRSHPWGSEVRLDLPLRFGFKGGFANEVIYPIGNEKRSIEEFVDQLQLGAVKELGLERLLGREREKAYAEGRREGYDKGYRDASSRQAGLILLEKMERAESDLAAIRAAHAVTS